jgi:L-alanine-DL-glutamate epimerase-like enolase superfamily enzyme
MGTSEARRAGWTRVTDDDEGSGAPLTRHPIDFVIRQVKGYRFDAPVIPPIRSSFGQIHERSCLLLSIEDMDGTMGWGEIWTGMPAFGAGHRHELLTRIAAPLLAGQRVVQIERIADRLQSAMLPIQRLAGEPGPVSHVIAGIDCALWDLAATRSGMPLYRFLGGTAPTMPTYASGIRPDMDAGAMDALRDAGFRAFKFKAGFDDAGTFGHLHRQGRGLAPGERMMIDANGGWEADAALRAFDALADCPLEWIEEPVGPELPDDAWRLLAARANHPMAAGENMLSRSQFVSAFEWLDVVQPDLGKWGGISGVVPLARHALTRGLRFCPHSFGTYIGAAHAAHVLAAVGGDGRLELDVNANPLRTRSAPDFPPVIDGRLALTDTPGIGIAVNVAALSLLSS